jgi:hypothetical protein
MASSLKTLIVCAVVRLPQRWHSAITRIIAAVWPGFREA